MSPPRRYLKNVKRQQPANPTAIPSLASVSGFSTLGPQPTGPIGPIQVDPNAPSSFSGGGQPLASNAPVVTLGGPPQSSSTSSDSSPSNTSAETSSASKSQLPIGTVVAACIGAFVGAIILISLFLWWCKRPSQSKARAANARGKVEQRQARGRSWNKLGAAADEEDKWEGNVGMQKVEMGQIQKDADEKNFPMFKKSPSMRTTRTAKALEEHGIDLPPFEFSQYHPSLAEELSLEQPAKPFASRQNSGSSNWDKETVGDDSFLSLRSVRVESGTMSPTLSVAKMTPPATAHALSLHKWESAEVLTMDANTSQPASNPFTDVNEERSSGANRAGNPFFSAQEMTRSASRRSRSNSRGSRTHSRNTSRASRATSRTRADSQVNPFDNESLPVAVSSFKTHHAQNDSIASGSSGSAFATEHAMKSLIAALNLTQEEVEERLRVASMQASTVSRYSALSGVSSTLPDDEADTATLKGYGAPASPLSPHAR